jgi:hypothetical protein
MKKGINKIKCFSDLITLIFLPLKQETGLFIYLFGGDWGGCIDQFD